MINTYLDSTIHSASLLLDLMDIPTITPGALVFVLLLLAFCILLSLEIHFPKEKCPIKKLRQSCFTNISLFMFNNAVLSLLSVSALLVLTEHYSNHGLLSEVTNPGWKIFLSFILLDLVAYLWHVACHQFNFLWMFHKVHHSDPYLNVSTAFRLHTIELGMFVVMKAGLIIILSVDKTSALACEAITTLFIMFHHTNIAFPGETQLSRLIIVPALHRLHHSIKRIEHDQNYGAVMSYGIDYSGR
ncbi:MAG: sterol desaturase family protein [Methylococcales bacterium]